jgi:hypothetical protein
LTIVSRVDRHLGLNKNLGRHNKKPKTSKFASMVDEGFLIGYGTNKHAYRVFNKTTGCVETTVDVKFDESNGSQREQVS